MAKFNVLLVGDECIDEYRYGTVDRLSPEAPVPIFRHSHTIEKAGMAANVKNNLEALGINVYFHGGELSKKTRLIDVRSGQHIVRIDEDNMSLPLKKEEWCDFSYGIEYDAIVISDYNKGLISYDTIKHIRDTASNKNVPIFVDTKKQNLSHFYGCFVKINHHEFSAATSFNDKLIVTLGAIGARYNDVVYKSKKVDVVDVCGAGDTFLSSLVYWYLSSGSIENSIRFANAAAGVTVQHQGVYAPSLDEINEVLYESSCNG